MSILSGISRLKEKQSEGKDRFTPDVALPVKTSRWFRAGFGLICLLALASAVLLAVFRYGDMPAAWAFSVGIESFSIVVSAIIYYCYMEDPDSVEAHMILFSSLLVADTLCLFLDECAWLVQGKAAFAALNTAANTLLYLGNCAVTIMFWRYAAFMLNIQEEVAHRVNRILSWLSALIEVILVLNLFVPLLFSVDAAGFYHREALFPLALGPVLVVLPALMLGFRDYDGSVKVKRAARLFFLMPILGILLTCFRFGVSTQYSAVMLSILLELGVVVSERGKRITVTRTELDTAGQIQDSMLPGTFPAFPDRPEFDLYASMDPAREVGGDFYDFFLTDDDHLALVIADVSDKGVPAALLMMSAKILIHYRARQGGTSGEILADVNEEMCGNNGAGMFVTVWMGLLDIREGTLVCTNAGHENPVIRRSGGAFRLFRDRHGLPVGSMTGLRYVDYTLQMGPGDLIFVYTDGVPEANNGAKEQYGTGRLEQALNRLEDTSPRGVIEGVRADVDAFVGGAKQFDDVTMLCLAYRGAGA